MISKFLRKHFPSINERYVRSEINRIRDTAEGKGHSIMVRVKERFGEEYLVLIGYDDDLLGRLTFAGAEPDKIVSPGRMCFYFEHVESVEVVDVSPGEPEMDWRSLVGYVNHCSRNLPYDMMTPFAKDKLTGKTYYLTRESKHTDNVIRVAHIYEDGSTMCWPLYKADRPWLAKQCDVGIGDEVPIPDFTYYSWMRGAVSPRVREEMRKTNNLDFLIEEYVRESTEKVRGYIAGTGDVSKKSIEKLRDLGEYICKISWDLLERNKEQNKEVEK